MTAESLWLLWTSRGWDAPFAIAELLVGWITEEDDDANTYATMGIFRDGTVCEGDEAGMSDAAVLFDGCVVNDYAPLLMALWVEKYIISDPGWLPPEDRQKWYDAWPKVKAVGCDPAIAEWARRIKA